MPSLLLELFSEEIPARLQRRASADLLRLVTDRLKANGYAQFDAKAFATPRRLTLVIANLPVAQADRKEEKKGPRVGAPEKAVEGFLRGAGLASLDQLEKRAGDKGEFYVAIIDEKGRSTADVIAEMIPAVIADFPWPKSMRWGEGELKWTRPLHRILCTFDGEIVPFMVGGIASGDITTGHRFIAPEPIQVRSFEPYQAALASANVILDSDERAEKILGEAKALASAQGLELIEDRGLLEEVAGLAEWPVSRIGNFDPKFLTVPDEALTAAMKGHQKYFSVRDPKTGRLAPKFICVANVEPADGGVAMMRGYERVLSARLSDAWFLYQQDLKTPLAEHAMKLSKISFFEGLGSVADKVERVALLAREIASYVGADPDAAEKAARLAKADLVTEMVYEFPELQGLMGRYYALAEGIDPAIADAVRDHYKPMGQGGDIPTAPVGISLALAEKLATLTMFWSIDQKPTGSKDPFALRRAGLGVIQIVLGNGVRLKLASHMSGLSDEARVDLMSFIHDRLSVYLREKGYAHDQVKAVLDPSQDDLGLVVRKLQALDAFVKTDDGVNLAAAYKRAGNILKAESKKGSLPELVIDASKFVQDEERGLHRAMVSVMAKTELALEAEDFSGAMSQLATLRAPLDGFFEAVTVNADEAALRANRLALLRNIVATCDRMANFSELEG